MSDLCDKTAVELRRLIGRKDVSPVELLDSCIARIEATDSALNAVVTRSFDRAREEALNAEKAVLNGEELGLLHGLPVGIKDLEATDGIRTTLGSQLYADHVPNKDQGSVANIRAEGGIIIGKTNTPEFGAGANTRNLVFGATGNPFAPEKTCGGSSGGSAVALATGMMPLATGSDYGGSLAHTSRLLRCRWHSAITRCCCRRRPACWPVCHFLFLDQWAALLMTPIYCSKRKWVLIRMTLFQPRLIWIYLRP